VQHLVEMGPHDELLHVTQGHVIGHVLAKPGVEYVVHVRKATSSFVITIAGVSTDLTGKWLDPTTGNTTALAHPLGNGAHALTAPAGFAAEDIVLHLS
jgi:hypothetical protein